ncbi:acetolactate decarboxylase [Chryseobacterium vrystaatense]|uniref:Alpha-acetolactate decarboxylase n=1 Tax=Chryseobacterium vrystaatense TaxID=307480 RepID=A0ABR4UGL9_9FLAO|nr:acetolactate decarboxylase [Chryseobacterium vrystaatense]KFF23678.1 alpha-acetolactate decarboxylase [Chryseobacterium vrystaatense]
MIKSLLTIAMLNLLTVPFNAQQHDDKIFHYSSMDAMRNGVYTGDITVKDAKQKGNFGLGTYNLLDGELIALDGNIYRIASDGSVETADLKRLIPFGSFTFFKKEQSIELQGVRNIADLQKKLIELLPSPNRFYAVKIEASFRSISLGGAEKVNEKDTRGIAYFMKSRPVYQKENVKGTLIGFYNPPYAGGLDLTPFHFHFLSDDKSVGGHLIEGIPSDLKITVELDEKNAYEVILPNSNEAGYQRKWSSSEAKAQY